MHQDIVRPVRQVGPARQSSCGMQRPQAKAGGARDARAPERINAAGATGASGASPAHGAIATTTGCPGVAWPSPITRWQNAHGPRSCNGLGARQAGAAASSAIRSAQHAGTAAACALPCSRAADIVAHSPGTSDRTAASNTSPTTSVCVALNQMGRYLCGREDTVASHLRLEHEYRRRPNFNQFKSILRYIRLISC